MPNPIGRRQRRPLPQRSLLLTAVFALPMFGTSRALETVRTDLWAANNVVWATAVSGNVLYIGGNFTQVGPAVGSFVVIDSASGALAGNFPKVAGQNVSTIVSDGTGGWYIGGQFSWDGGLPRSGIAHILADNSISSWNPGSIGAQVNAIAVDSATIYIGGSFTSVAGQTRNRVAALDAVTGALKSWDPNASSTVNDIVVAGGTVYAAGSFTTIGGQQRKGVAALDPATGLATEWNANCDGSVLSLLPSGGILYVGGGFTTIGGQVRSGLAALDMVTASASSWDPPVNSSVRILQLDGSTIYAGGDFTTIGGQSRNGLAAIDAASGNVLAWDPAAGPPFVQVTSLAIAGGMVYAGGSFTQIGGQDRNHIAALDPGTGNATSWNPDLNSFVLDLKVQGGLVYAGGSFTIQGAVTRNHLAALDLVTGAATAWNPNPDNEVRCIVPDANRVYVGGVFQNIAGQPRDQVAALTPDTGEALAWNPNPDGRVNAILVNGTTVYIGGDFTTVGGQPQPRIVAVNATTGTRLPAWSPNPNKAVFSLALVGTSLFMGGEFTTVAGQARGQVAAVVASTGSLLPWNAGISGVSSPQYVPALVTDGNTLYAGGYFTSVGGQPQRYLAALDLATAELRPWNVNANGAVSALARNGGTLLAGGSFLSIGGQTRRSVAEVQLTDATATTWDPHIAAASTQIYSISRDATHVYVGGNFRGAGGEPQSYVAAIESPVPVDVSMRPGGEVLSVGRQPARDDQVQIRYSIGRDEMALHLRIYDATGRMVRSFQSIGTTPGEHAILWNVVDAEGNRLARGIYIVQLETSKARESRKLVLLRGVPR